jgi:hypothetical protein
MIGFTIGALVMSLAAIWGLAALAINFNKLVEEKEEN